MVFTSVCDNTHARRLPTPDLKSYRGCQPSFSWTQRDVGETMADVAVAASAGDGRRDVFVHRGGERRGDFLDADALPAAHVQRQPVRPVLADRRDIGPGNVLNVDEIPSLLTVFEDQRRLVLQQTAAENRRHAGVGIGKGLARRTR